MAAISDRKTWPVINQQTRAKKGPLIRVQHPDGHYTKMYEQDAIAAGLVPGKKLAAAPDNKLAPMPAENKSVDEEPAGPDDFTTIKGVGRASAKSLTAQGITSYEQLRQADLSQLALAANVIAAIEEWRA